MHWALLCALWCWALLPIGFLLFPISRRRAKVRWRHIFRITAYSTVFPWAIFSLILIWGSLFAATQEYHWWLYRSVWNASVFVCTPALILWWSAAVRRYLKMPRAFPIAFSLGLVAWLLFMILTYFVFPLEFKLYFAT
jgi:hypothetical protein